MCGIIESRDRAIWKKDEVGRKMNDYEKLVKITAQIDELLKANVTSESPEFKAWRFKTKKLLKAHYGLYSDELGLFLKTQFSPWNDYGEVNEQISECKKGLRECQELFKVYLEELKSEDLCEAVKSVEEMGGSVMKLQEIKEIDFSRVFIVHGHNDALKQEVARIIEKQGLEAIILSEQVNGGKTIIEKIEENSDVGAAICLFTGDDYGKTRDAKEEKLRARQNVVFEAGYFMGKLGRKNVIVVADKNLELPSDMQGVVYTDSTNWKAEVLQGLDEIGYPIDFNKLFKR